MIERKDGQGAEGFQTNINNKIKEIEKKGKLESRIVMITPAAGKNPQLATINFETTE